MRKIIHCAFLMCFMISAAGKAAPSEAFDWDTLATTSGFQMPSNYPTSEQEAYLSGSIYNDWFDSGCALPGSPYNGELGLYQKNHHVVSLYKEGQAPNADKDYASNEISRCLNKDGRLEEMYFVGAEAAHPSIFGPNSSLYGSLVYHKFYHYYQPTPNSGTMKGTVTSTNYYYDFTMLSSESNPLARAPQLARNLRGGIEAHLEMFYIDGQKFPFTLMNRFQDSKAPGGWTAPSLMPLSEGVRDFAVFRNQKGAIEVLALVVARGFKTGYAGLFSHPHKPSLALKHYYQVLNEQGQFVKWVSEDWGTLGGRLTLILDKWNRVEGPDGFINWGRTPHGDFVVSIPRLALQGTDKSEFQQSFQLVQTYTPSKGWYWFIDDHSMNLPPRGGR